MYINKGQTNLSFLLIKLYVTFNITCIKCAGVYLSLFQHVDVSHLLSSDSCHAHFVT